MLTAPPSTGCCNYSVGSSLCQLLPFIQFHISILLHNKSYCMEKKKSEDLQVMGILATKVIPATSICPLPSLYSMILASQSFHLHSHFHTWCTYRRTGSKTAACSLSPDILIIYCYLTLDTALSPFPPSCVPSAKTPGLEHKVR